MTLTTRQREVWNYWRNFQAEHRGVPPSIREAMVHFGMSSPNGIFGHVELLLKHGAFVRVLAPTEKRGIVAVDLSESVNQEVQP